MDDIKKQQMKKKGYYTPEEVLDEAKAIVNKSSVKSVMVIVQHEDDRIERMNTEMSFLNLCGVLEFTKVDSMLHDDGWE